ncbi:MAG TPA: hypothetical protein VF649_01365 [Sphingomonas sp.]|uniref:helix-turn-helix transcriptional regulator n=1 Tax=Sphingomonas sp. TaxID=28214 RepID=UPI002ED8EC1F
MSRLIADIYAGAHDAPMWDRTMEAVGARLDASWLMVAAFDWERRAPTGSCYYLASDSRFAMGVEEYAADFYRVDPVNAFATNRAAGGVFDSRAIADPGVYLTDDYVRWNQDRFGSAFWRFHQAEGHGVQLGLSLHRTAEDGPLDGEQARLLELLFSHMNAAVRLASKPPALDDGDPVILLNQAGHVVLANEPAERLLTRREGIAIVDGRPRATDRHSARALDAAVRAAIVAFVAGTHGGSAALRRHGGPPLLATILPLPASAAPLGTLRPAAMIRLIDPATPPPAPRADWRALFGFTPAESRLAATLMAGDGNLRQTADALGITYHTARSQVASLFDKAGVASQMQLVRLLARIGCWLLATLCPAPAIVERIAMV